MEFILNNIKIGDMIVRKKGIITTHYMIYLGIRNGLHMVAENQLGYGVRIVSLIEGLNGNSILRIEPFKGQEYHRMYVWSYVETLLGKAYNLISFNCEHFARLIADGKVNSKQVEVGSKIALTGGLTLVTIGAAKSNKILMWVGILTTLGGFIGQSAQRNKS